MTCFSHDKISQALPLSRVGEPGNEATLELILNRTENTLLYSHTLLSIVADPPRITSHALTDTVPSVTTRVKTVESEVSLIISKVMYAGVIIPKYNSCPC